MSESAFINVPVNCLPVVLSALRKAGQVEAAQQATEASRHYLDPDANASRLGWLRWARQEYEAEDIEFDDDATVSETDDDGAFVLGWVWVTAPRHAGCECCHCDEVIAGEADGTSTPHGSMHHECAAEHEAEHPDDW